jgi:hypothetical protein
MISHFGVVRYFINSYGEANCRSCELHTFKRRRLFYLGYNTNKFDYKGSFASLLGKCW